MSSQERTINRITLFKIPNESDRVKLLDIYRTMHKDALKDGKQYILSVTAGQAFQDARNQGYTLTVVSKFSSVEDMKYYDHHQVKVIPTLMHVTSNSVPRLIRIEILCREEDMKYYDQTLPGQHPYPDTR